MSSHSRKKKRREEQRQERIFSAKLLKIVSVPLFLFVLLIITIYGTVKLRNQPVLERSETDRSKGNLIIKEKKYADVFSWQELMEALANQELTEINIKKNIVLPQNKEKLTLKNITTVVKQKRSYYDNLLKKTRSQDVLLVTFNTKKISRSIVISGENKIIDLGNVQFDLPQSLDLAFKDIVVVRSYYY